MEVTMKKILLISLVICLMGMICLEAKDYKFEEKEEIQKTLKFQDPAKPRELLIDNVFGSIWVEGTTGQEIELVAHKIIKAKTQDRIQKAKEDVKLEITEDGNTIDLFVDGPFRCPDDRGRWRNNWRDPGYKVKYDFELKVPRKTSLFLKTVNNGHILVKNIEGEFEIKNVNGRIEMTEVAGSGEAHTVNGEVEVVFARNPESDCSFHTINGDIKVSFRENLSANFRLKTFNGDALSDFPVTYLPVRAAVQTHKKGKYVYKSDRFTGIRVNKGGPEIEIDTLNGDILITKKR